MKVKLLTLFYLLFLFIEAMGQNSYGNSYNPSLHSLQVRQSHGTIQMPPNPDLRPRTIWSNVAKNDSTEILSPTDSRIDDSECSSNVLRALVARNNKYGFVNEIGEEIIPVKYDKATNFYNGHACVLDGKRLYLIDSHGNVVKELSQINDVSNFYKVYNPLDGSVFVGASETIYEDDPSCIFITWDTDGTPQEIHLTLTGGQLWHPYQGLLSENVRYYRKKRIIKASTNPKSDDEIAVYSDIVCDKQGNQRFVLTENQNLQPFSCGLARITDYKKNSAAVRDTANRYNIKYEFIDVMGRRLPNCSYDYALSFSNSLACVHKNGKSGYIDATGKVVIPFIFDGEKGRNVSQYYKEHPH